jgi:hypothetical protein
VADQYRGILDGAGKIIFSGLFFVFEIFVSYFYNLNNNNMSQANQFYPILITDVITASTAAALTTAVNDAINAIAGNTQNVTDITGTAIGAQNVFPASTAVQYVAPFLDAAGADVYSAMVT